MIGFIRIIVVLFCLNIFFGCGDDPSDIASGISGDEIATDIVGVNQTSNVTFKKVFELGIASRLLVGKNDNVEASFLIQFSTPMLDSLKNFLRADSLTVISNKIFLSPIYKFGDSTAVLDFTAHKILATWDAYTFTFDSLSPLRYDYQNIISTKSINNDTLHYVSINNNVVQEWLKAEADSLTKINNGILIKPTSSSNRILGYQGFTSGSSINPRIEIVYQKLGAYIDTLTYYTDQDVHVVDGNIPAMNSDEIILRSGVSVQGRLNFALDSIPKNVVINHATLTLTLDTIKSKFGSGMIDDLILYYVTDSSTNEFSASTSALLRRDKNKFTGDVTRIIDRQYHDGNYGVIIRPAGYLEGVEKFVLKNHLTVATGDAPKINVIFTKRK